MSILCSLRSRAIVLNCGVRFILDKIRYHENCVRYVPEFIELSNFQFFSGTQQTAHCKMVRGMTVHGHDSQSNTKELHQAMGEFGVWLNPGNVQLNATEPH
jgi:hypothetical protein